VRIHELGHRRSLARFDSDWKIANGRREFLASGIPARLTRGRSLELPAFFRTCLSERKNVFGRRECCR